VISTILESRSILVTETCRAFTTAELFFKCSKHESLWKVQVNALLKVLRETFISQAAIDSVRNHKVGGGESYLASTVNKAEEFLYLWDLRTFHRNYQHQARASLQKTIVIEATGEK